MYLVKWHEKQRGQARLPIIIPHSLPRKRPPDTQLQVTMETQEGEQRGRGLENSADNH